MATPPNEPPTGPPNRQDTTLTAHSQSSVKTDDDDAELSSLKTLKTEISGYMENADSFDRWGELYPGVERMEYNFSLERPHLYSSNLIESTSHLIKGCLGAGILSIHEGYMRGGIWASLAVTAVIGAIVPYNMNMLVACAHKMYIKLRVPKLTYPDLMEAAVAIGPIKKCRKFSKAFRYTIDVCLFVELCGTCCIYEIMIAKTCKQTIEAAFESVEELSIRMYIVLVTIPLFLLCMIRNLKYLAPFCMVADLFVAVCVLTTMYYSISKAGDLSVRPAFKSFSGLMQFCGVFLYSIDGVGITLPVENNMAKPQYFSIVLQIGMTTVILFTTLTGFFGYWGWGEDCESPITIHMPMETFPIILQFLLMGILAVTFAVNFWVPFKIIWHYVSKSIVRRRELWERFCRGVHVVLITSLALYYPNMTRLMIILGNFFLAFITFIFPAVIDSLVSWKDPRRWKIRWRFIKNIIIILFGIMLSLTVFFI